MYSDTIEVSEIIDILPDGHDEAMRVMQKVMEALSVKKKSHIVTRKVMDFSSGNRVTALLPTSTNHLQIFYDTGKVDEVECSEDVGLFKHDKMFLPPNRVGVKSFSDDAIEKLLTDLRYMLTQPRFVLGEFSHYITTTMASYRNGYDSYFYHLYDNHGFLNQSEIESAFMLHAFSQIISQFPLNRKNRICVMHSTESFMKKISVVVAVENASRNVSIDICTLSQLEEGILNAADHCYFIDNFLARPNFSNHGMSPWCTTYDEFLDWKPDDEVSKALGDYETLLIHDTSSLILTHNVAPLMIDFDSNSEDDLIPKVPINTGLSIKFCSPHRPRAFVHYSARSPDYTYPDMLELDVFSTDNLADVYDEYYCYYLELLINSYQRIMKLQKPGDGLDKMMQFFTDYLEPQFEWLRYSTSQSVEMYQIPVPCSTKMIRTKELSVSETMHSIALLAQLGYEFKDPNQVKSEGWTLEMLEGCIARGVVETTQKLGTTWYRAVQHEDTIGLTKQDYRTVMKNRVKFNIANKIHTNVSNQENFYQKDFQSVASGKSYDTGVAIASSEGYVISKGNVFDRLVYAASRLEDGNYSSNLVRMYLGVAEDDTGEGNSNIQVEDAYVDVSFIDVSEMGTSEKKFPVMSGVHVSKSKLRKRGLSTIKAHELHT